MFSSIPRLNADVLEVIFDAIDFKGVFEHETYFPHHDNGSLPRNRCWVSLLCLVSRDWTNPARRVLYRVIPDLERTRLQLLVRTLGNSSLGKYVRAIYTSPYDEVMGLAGLLPKAKIYLLLPRSSRTPEGSASQLSSLAGLHIKDVSWSREEWVHIFEE
jgi:hypothetical protein